MTADVGTVFRVKFEAHGGREETYLNAVDQFERLFEEGWRIVYIAQELDTGMHEDLERIPDEDKWDVEYHAIGLLRGSE